MKKILSILLTLALLCFALSACSPSQPSAQPEANSTQPAPQQPEGKAQENAAGEKPQVIRVGSLSRELAVPFYYMHEMGWDVENGFEIELSAYDSGALVNEAQAAGLWDVTAIGAAGIQSMAKYGCVHLYPHQDSGAGIDLIARPDSEIMAVKGYNPDYPEIYGSPETVKGKTILVAIGSGNHMETSLWLKALGLTDEDVNLVHMDYAQGWQAFRNGEGDIYSGAFPWSITAYEEGYKQVASFETLKTAYANNVYATTEFYNEHYDALVAMIKQLIRACDALQDVDLVTEVAMEWYHLNGNMVSEEEARIQMESQPFWGTEVITSEGFDSTSPVMVQAEFMHSIGSITDDEFEFIKNNLKTDVLRDALAQQ